MRKIAVLIFPHQLFADHPALIKNTSEKVFEVFLVEEYLFFAQYNFHAHKLVLHRATMKAYGDVLRKKGYTVHYIEHSQLPTTESLFSILKLNGITEIHLADVVDEWLSKRSMKYAKLHSINVVWHETPMFLNTEVECKDWVKLHPKLLMHNFYIAQRKKFSILVEQHIGSVIPVGGSWSFDSENRKKIPKGTILPTIDFQSITHGDESYVSEAIEYVRKHFPHAYGDPAHFMYAVTHHSAKRALIDFVKNRLILFGPYEDAIQHNEPFLYHSVLTPYLNCGLLTPMQVIESVLGVKDEIPLQSLEGFIRQIIGWREFMRVVYISHGSEMRTRNYWGHTQALPQTFWTAETGIDPVDETIKRTLKTAYNHHIERLMVLGNFMLLSEYNPDDVYVWFMEMYIDSYDWVMVPNVYGMSQFADGGIFATKPYISASNYILKMSNYKKGKWSEIWDTKFWNFLMKHEVFFSKNPRMNMLLQVRKKKMNL